MRTFPGKKRMLVYAAGSETAVVHRSLVPLLSSMVTAFLPTFLEKLSEVESETVMRRQRGLRSRNFRQLCT